MKPSEIDSVQKIMSEIDFVKAQIKSIEKAEIHWVRYEDDQPCCSRLAGYTEPLFWFNKRLTELQDLLSRI